MSEFEPIAVVLPRHEALGSCCRPTFLFKGLTGRAWRLLRRLQRVSDDASDADAADVIDAAYETLDRTMIGWRNVRDPLDGDGPEVEFAIERIQDLITVQDAFALLTGLTAGGLSVASKKGSPSPSPDLPADSATAPADDGSTPRA